jgi:photosystem I P700 chlorophyll a apoprotein A1
MGHSVLPLVGQYSLNAPLGGYYNGICLTSGLFQLYRSSGIVSLVNLKIVSASVLLCSVVFLGAAFLVMHLYIPSEWFSSFRSFRPHHLGILLGLGSISYAGHLIHIALPINLLIDAGVDPSLISSDPHLLLSADFYRCLFPGFGSGLVVNPHIFCFNTASFGPLHEAFNYSTGCISLGYLAFHHFCVGFVFIMASTLSLFFFNGFDSPLGLAYFYRSWDSRLGLSLGLLGTLCIMYANLSYSVPVFPLLSIDYPSVQSLFSHHMFVGSCFLVGASAHSSIFMIRDYSKTKILSLEYILAQRDIILGHLIWVCLFLGFHSFGIYIHNDSMQALGRLQDLFTDSSFQLRPILASFCLRTFCLETKVLHSQVLLMGPELGTSDFLLNHIHSLNLHVVVLILVKGSIFSRSSRLVSDKLLLGFRYPCDGPGRGGSCQISPWDHIFLSIFWVYNLQSIVSFHFFWKAQSDIWGFYSSKTGLISHLSGGNFSSNSSTINGWLRDLLWAHSASVLQSYGTPLAAYSILFLYSHFVWAFSLMFLFSGRGYWQELIESIVWSHTKLYVVPSIQPRALSITHGRAVGLVHFVLGGISCSGSFLITSLLS